MHKIQKTFYALLITILFVLPVGVVAYEETADGHEAAEHERYPAEGEPYHGDKAEPYHEPSHFDEHDGYDKYDDRDHDACRAYDEERRAAADRLHQEIRAKWDAYDAEWREFQSEEHDQEEWQAFEERMRQKERDIRAWEDAAFRELEEKYRDHPDCGGYGGGGYAGPGANDGNEVDGPCSFDEMERLFRDFEDHLRDRQDESHAMFEKKHETFMARHEEQARAFESENHTDEEREAFYAEQSRAMQEFQERLMEEQEAFFRGLEAEREAFRLKQEERCAASGHAAPADGKYDEDRYAPEHRPGPSAGIPDARFAALHEEMEILRLECELDAKRAFTAEMRKIDAEHEDGDGSFDRSFEEKVRAIEESMHQKMRDCMQRIQELWAQKMETSFSDQDHHEFMGSWQMSGDPEGGKVQLQGKYMTITGDPQASVLSAVAVQGQVWLDGIATDSYFDDDQWDMGEDGRASWLSAGGDGVRMRLHDNPAGLIKFRSEDGYSFLLKIPNHLDVERGPNGWRLSADGQSATIRVAEADSAWDAAARVLSVSGEAEFFLPDHAENKVLGKVANKHRGEIMTAAEQKHLGAEITVTKDGNGNAVDETLVYDDVAIEVAADEATEQVAVTFSADSSESGKSFVVNIDDQVVRLGGSLEILYFDVDEETGEESAAEIRKASSLADVLDATDDESAEYWIVEDEDGAQVIVSVPHWSTHRLKVSSIDAEPVNGFGDLDLDGWFAYGAVAVAGAVAAIGATAIAKKRRGEL